MIALRYIIVILLSTILLVPAVWSTPTLQANDSSFTTLITSLSVFRTFLNEEIGIADKEKLNFLKDIMKFQNQQEKLSKEIESYDPVKCATAKIVMSKLMKETCKMLNRSNPSDCSKYLKKLSLLVDLEESAGSFLRVLKAYDNTQWGNDCQWIRLNIICNTSVNPEVSAFVASKFPTCFQKCPNN